MENKNRKNQLKIYLTDEELEFFKNKQKLSKCSTMSHFIRKCILEKEIYYVDLSYFGKFHTLLSNIANNTNQYAKKANESGIVDANDFEKYKNEIESLSKEQLKISNALRNAGIR